MVGFFQEGRLKTREMGISQDAPDTRGEKDQKTRLKNNYGSLESLQTKFDLCQLF